MRKTILIICLLLVAVAANADCVGTVTSVTQDQKRGSVIVQTEYKINGDLVQTGNVRYLETSGTLQEIKDLIDADKTEHCQNLIQRMDGHEAWIATQRLNRQKELTSSLVASLQSEINKKTTVTEANITYKGKILNVKTDGTHAISDAP